MLHRTRKQTGLLLAAGQRFARWTPHDCKRLHGKAHHEQYRVVKHYQAGMRGVRRRRMLFHRYGVATPFWELRDSDRNKDRLRWCYQLSTSSVGGQTYTGCGIMLACARACMCSALHCCVYLARLTSYPPQSRSSFSKGTSRWSLISQMTKVTNK